MTEKDQATSILAALNAALDPTVAYDLDKVPGVNGNAGTRPTKFATISISEKYEGKRRGSGETSVEGFRIVVRYAAKSTNDARNMRALTKATLSEKTVGSGANEIGPFVFQSSQAIAPDDGYQSGSDTYTF